MAEQTFRSPGFFEREIDLTERISTPSGTPAGIIGTSETGPAFVPTTVGSFQDWSSRFGSFEPNRHSTYAVNEWLKNKNSLTFLRVLGAGSNNSVEDIQTTKQYGIVKNAGFVISGGLNTGGNTTNGTGFVQFLVAEHDVNSLAANTYPIFNNRSIADGAPSSQVVNLVRAVLFFTSGSRGYLTGTSDALTANDINTNVGNFASDASEFKFVISSSLGTNFLSDDGIPGIKVYTCSLNPNSDNYYAKVLNTDPLKFQTEQHYLYADFAVDSELAEGSVGAPSDVKIALASGSNNQSDTVSGLVSFNGASGVKFRELFGRYDTRYRSAKTTNFISQPYGEKEYDLFHFEALTDGAYPNSRFKISIANLRSSTDPNNPFGTFEVQVRQFNDTDTNPKILEAFPDLNLNPNSDRYIARVIGDRSVAFNHDAELADERRLVVKGRYGNQSRFIRVVMNESVDLELIPKTSLPFGFRGVPTLKTTDSLTDLSDVAIVDTNGNVIGNTTNSRLAVGNFALTGSIVPPLPMRFKVTRGALASSTTSDVGKVGVNTRVDRRYYWGVQTTRFRQGNILDPNLGSVTNPLVESYTKFLGLEKMDALVTGSGADAFCDNKFTLARVALSASNFNELTSSADDHMLHSVYVRDAVPAGTNYVVSAGGDDRLTMASLVNENPVLFNRFTPFNKFTNIMFGGFDGLNILDKESFYMTDRASSTDAGGYAVDNNPRLGLNVGTIGKQSGAGTENNSIASYRTAIEIMTDPFAVRTNLLAIPGIRDSFVTDFASDKVRQYGMAAYIMDIPSWAVTPMGDKVRLFRDAEDVKGLRPDSLETAERFDARAIDNNYVAAYYPDVTITDESTGRSVEVPASVAVIGALGFNDRVTFPWFAPAGFNRGSLDFVTNTSSRLLQGDRDVLYDARINPISNFPIEASSRQQYVIFGQKTLQQAQSALDRLNVRRLILEVKRLVSDIARDLLFEQNDQTTRNVFVNRVTPLLATISAQQGIEQFNVVCDTSNNSDLDVEQNRMNGRIIIVPTRTIEFVAIDFIVTNSGVTFE
jgi:hypothetical protein